VKNTKSKIRREGGLIEDTGWTRPLNKIGSLGRKSNISQDIKGKKNKYDTIVGD
jgi:hypothetical protein